MLSRVSRVVALKAAAVAILAWGCSSLPTEPSPSGIAATPSFVRVKTGGTTPFSATGSSPNSKDIDGSKGGTFTSGHFTLVVPPGAFAGKATLTIVVPDPNEMRCSLSISPPEANRFAVPVQLVSDCSSAVSVDPRSLQTMWFDEGNAKWVVVPGSVITATTLTISTPLMHFSDYGILGSKAGW